MRRRDFIKAVSAVAWPLAPRAQQPIKVPRIGVLWHAGNEQEEAIYLGAMRQGFRDHKLDTKPADLTVLAKRL
jgi:putative ABC transport system substrate-binding protein